MAALLGSRSLPRFAREHRLASSRSARRPLACIALLVMCLTVAGWLLLRSTGAAGAAEVEGPTRADIVFVIDATGSMGDEIADVKESLVGIGNRLAMRKPRPDVRFGAVFYRDVSDKDIVREVHLSEDLNEVRQAILDVEADGGGDWPEHVGIGLHKALEMDWSHSADGGVRLIYLVGDAPPQEYGDGYDVDSALTLAKNLGVKVHVIGCSGLGSGTDAMQRIAEATGGDFSMLQRRSGGQHSASHARSAEHPPMRTPARMKESVGMAGPVIAIDLGTAHTRVGVRRSGHTQIIPNAEEELMTPSYVAFTDAGRLVGSAARHRLAADPERTFYDIKRLIGRRFDDRRLQKDVQRLPFNVTIQDGHMQVSILREGEAVSLRLEEVLAALISEMKTSAGTHLGMEVEQAVITVPAHFNDSQRQAIKAAGVTAGLNVLRIINEPTASAIAYGLDKANEKNILVYHFGGGCFDASLLTIDNGVFEVVATTGDPRLGGTDLDGRVVEHLTKLFESKHGGSLAKDARALQKLRRAAQRAKEELSSSVLARIDIEDLHNGSSFTADLSRSRFEALNEDLFGSTLKHVEQVLEDSGVPRHGVDEIVLSGGSSRIPRVQQLVRNFFSGKEPRSGIHPEETVVLGAAFQASVLSSESTSDLLLLDVTPLTLGIEGANGTMLRLISRNTVIPTKKSWACSTFEDNQTLFAVHVFEGEHAVARKNHLLATLNVTGIPPAPAGVPQLEVTLEIDSNGILQVTAGDKGSGKFESLWVSNDEGRLTEEQVERMIREAEVFSAGDEEPSALAEPAGANLPLEDEEAEGLGRLSAMMFASIKSEL